MVLLRFYDMTSEPKNKTNERREIFTQMLNCDKISVFAVFGINVCKANHVMGGRKLILMYVEDQQLMFKMSFLRESIN